MRTILVYLQSGLDANEVVGCRIKVDKEEIGSVEFYSQEDGASLVRVDKGFVLEEHMQPVNVDVIKNIKNVKYITFDITKKDLFLLFLQVCLTITILGFLVFLVKSCG